MATKRRIIRVVPNSKKGGWKVTRANRTVSTHQKKTTAVQTGRRLAKKGQGPSQLVIHKKNGRIQTEHTYQKDPYPPKG